MSRLELHEESGLAMIPDADGEMRVLGCLPPRQTNIFASFAERFDVSGVSLQEIELASWDKPALTNQGRQSSCFPAGTRVRMGDGTERPVEKVRLLDKVLTAEGNVSHVTSLMVREEAQSVFRLRAWGHAHLRATGEHPILTRRGYVPLKDILPGDWIALPRYLPCSGDSFETAPYIPKWGRVQREDKRQAYAGVLGRGGVDVQIKTLPDVICLTPGVGRIFGLFLAEGCTQRRHIVWSFSADEESTLVAELATLLQQEWGVTAHVAWTQSRTGINVALFGVDWARMFEGLFGSGAGRKAVPALVMSGPRDFLHCVYEAWVDGDGHRRRGGSEAISISHDLAMSMYDIAQAVGLRPAILHTPPVQNRHAKVRQWRWEVHARSTDDNYRVEMDEKYVWRKVREVTAEPFSGHVYNMSVAGDESYVAEGVGVHNCTGHAAKTAVEAVWSVSGLPKPAANFSPTYLYAWCNGGLDRGAVIADVCAALMAHGICTEAEAPEGKIYRQQFAAGADSVAQAYKPLAVLTCRTYDEILAATALGFPVVFGIMVGANFAQVDAQGMSPLPDRVVGGHALPTVGLKSAGAYGLVPVIQNSWGKQGYGRNGDGRGLVQRRHFQQQVDAFAVVAMGSGPDGPDIMPVAARRAFFWRKDRSKSMSHTEQQHGEHSHLMASAERAGFSLPDFQSVIAVYGPKVAADAVALVASGFSVAWVMQALTDLGPGVVALLAAFRAQAEPQLQAHARNMQSMKAGATIAQGQQVGSALDGPLAKVLIQQLINFLPALGFSGPALALAQGLLNSLLSSSPVTQ